MPEVTTSVDTETGVRNMLALAADSDLGDPWNYVQAALRVLPPECVGEFMDTLHADLVAAGYEPTVSL